MEEFLNRGAYNVFDTNYHCGPIIRILEFYIGMLLSPLYFTLKDYLDKFQNKFTLKMISTIIQIILPIYLCYLMIKFDNILIYNKIDNDIAYRYLKDNIKNIDINILNSIDIKDGGFRILKKYIDRYKRRSENDLVI